MTNTSRWKPFPEIASHVAPWQVVTLAATAQDRPPQISHDCAKSTRRRAVHGHLVIPEVPQQDRAQIRSLFPNGRVHASPQFFFQKPQLSLPPLAHRLSQHREVPLPGLAAAMRKSQEVERVQHLDRGTLDDLIFQRGNAEWAKLTRFTHLRDVNSTHRSRSVRSPLEPMGEILQVRLKVLSVVLPGLSVDACGRVLLNSQVGCPQSFLVGDVVQERSEPLFLVIACCLTYPLERAERAFPALSPERVTLGRVPLGSFPSLPRLRCQSLGIVRRLRRFYETVRLPASVRHRRTSFDFPTRSAVLSSADR